MAESVIKKPQVLYAAFSGTTNSAGSLSLGAFSNNRIILGVTMSPERSMVVTVGHSGNWTYIHCETEYGSPIDSTAISGYYAYIPITV